MSEKTEKKISHDLFAEIDALCGEIDEAVLDANVKNAATIQEVRLAQEERDRKNRQHEYAALLACCILDIEIAPFESPHNRALLVVRSLAGVIRKPVEIAESFGLIEFLLSKGFVVLATGKTHLTPASRGDEPTSITWFVLNRTYASKPVFKDLQAEQT